MSLLLHSNTATTPTPATTTPTKRKNGDATNTTATATTVTLSPKYLHRHPNMSVSMNGSYFEDDVFHTLDDVTSHQPSTNINTTTKTTTDHTKSSRLNSNVVIATNDEITVDTNYTELSQHPPPSPLLDDNTFHDKIPTEENMDRRQHVENENGITITDDDNNSTYETYNDTMDKLSFMSLLDSKGNFEVAVGNDVYEPTTAGRQLYPVPLVVVMVVKEWAVLVLVYMH